jgi:hypothetical protein
MLPAVAADYQTAPRADQAGRSKGCCMPDPDKGITTCPNTVLHGWPRQELTATFTSCWFQARYEAS